ncbi:ATP-binding protein [Arenimonas sp. MALMAid1274]|uniref:sensor histidine kinase n=1 Tax=Arenimonas sp. MALMAid1274 TaxID=3411630 RepID=UPI003BA026B1
MNTPAAASRQRGWLILLSALALAIALGSSIYSLRTTQRLADSIASVSHTQRVLEQVNRYWGVLGDRDSSILRYLLSGDPESLATFRRTLVEMEQAHQQLHALVGDNAAQRARLDRIEDLHRARVRRADEVIAIKQRAEAGDPAAQAQMETEFDGAPPSNNAESMRVLLEDMADSEKQLLAQRSEQRTQMIRQNRITVLGANGLALLAGAAVLLALRRLRRRAEEAQRARAEMEQAQRAEREQGALLAVQQRLARERQEGLDLIAHDLRQHFGNILFGLDLLETADRADAREQLTRTARGAANSGLLFLQAVLEQGAEEAHGEPAAPVVLAPLVRDTVAAHQRQSQERQMPVHLALDESLSVRAQPTGVGHVLANLLSNALKYAPAGSAVDIVLRASQGRARLEVMDRGPGVPASEQPALFRRFAPLSARPSEGEVATGLGLALARQRARAQGAELRYEDRPGGGACFVVEWPLA